jgi:hypothetical protein
MRKQLGRGWLSAVSLLAVGLVWGLLAASPASADTLYQINQPNAALVGFAPPYADVNVHLSDPTHATITFTRDGIYLMGGVSAADVNVNATTFTVGSITCAPLATCGPVSNGGAGNVSTFGNFNQTINSFDGFTAAATTISFILTNTGGTWLSDATVLINNSAGFLAAAHIFVPGTNCDGSPCTGFAGNGPPLQQQPVPEPATLLLLGSGLVGLGGGALKRRWAARRVA